MNHLRPHHGKFPPHRHPNAVQYWHTHLHRSHSFIINYKKQSTKLAAPRIPQYAPFATRPSTIEPWCSRRRRFAPCSAHFEYAEYSARLAVERWWWINLPNHDGCWAFLYMTVIRSPDSPSPFPRSYFPPSPPLPMDRWRIVII